VPREIDYEGGKEIAYSTNGKGEMFTDILSRRISRRGLVRTGIAASAMVAAVPALASAQKSSSLTAIR
jgi:hypothetical protein